MGALGRSLRPSSHICRVSIHEFIIRSGLPACTSLAIPEVKVGAATGPQVFSPCGFCLPSRPVPSSCLSCLTPTQTESDLQCQIPCRLRFWLLRDICCSQECKTAAQIEFLFSDPIRCTQLLRAAFLREAWLSMDGTSKIPFVLLAMP